MTGDSDRLVAALERLTQSLHGSGINFSAMPASRASELVTGRNLFATGHAESLTMAHSGYAPFSNPLANMAYSGLSQYAAEAMLGYTPLTAPPTPLGVSSFDADYSARSTTPATQLANQLTGTEIARQAATVVGSVMDGLGLTGEQDKSSYIADFAKRVESNPIARTSAELLMQTDMMKQLTGGDTAHMMRNVQSASPLAYNREGALSLRMVNDDGTINMALGTELAEESQESAASLNKFLQDENGLVDLAKTRGFDVAQIGDMYRMMAEKGYVDATTGQDFRTASDDVRNRMTAEQTKVRESLSNLSGSTDMNYLNEMLESLTGGEARQLDPAAMSDALDNMKAMATVLGKDGGQFLEAAIKAQNQTAAAAGMFLGNKQAFIGRDGQVKGPYLSLDYTRELTNDAYALAGVRRDLSDTGVERAGEDMAVLKGLFTQSTQGRASVMVELLRERGKVTDDDYESLLEAEQSGDKRLQRLRTTEIFRKSGEWGSTPELAYRELADDEFFSQFVVPALSGEGLARHDARGLVLNRREFQERFDTRLNKKTDQLLAAGLREGAGTYEAEKGVTSGIDDARVEAMAEAAGEAGDLIRDVYRRTGRVGAVEKLLGDDTFASSRERIITAGDDASRDAVLELNKSEHRLLRGELDAGVEWLDNAHVPGAKDFTDKITKASTPAELEAIRAEMLAAAGPDGSYTRDTLEKTFEEKRGQQASDIAQSEVNMANQTTSRYVARLKADNQVVNAENLATAINKAAEESGSRERVTVDQAGQMWDDFQDSTEYQAMLTQHAGGIPEGALATLEQLPEVQAAAAAASINATDFFLSEGFNVDTGAADRAGATRRMVNAVVGGGSIMDALGVKDPTITNPDDLAKLSDEQRVAYDKQVASYNKYKGLKAKDLMHMTAAQVKKLTGGGDAEQGLLTLQEGMKPLTALLVAESGKFYDEEGNFRREDKLTDILGVDKLDKGDAELLGAGRFGLSFGDSRLLPGGSGHKSTLGRLMELDDDTAEQLSPKVRRYREQALSAVEHESFVKQQKEQASAGQDGGGQRISGSMQIKVGQRLVAELVAEDDLTLDNSGEGAG